VAGAEAGMAAGCVARSIRFFYGLRLFVHPDRFDLELVFATPATNAECPLLTPSPWFDNRAEDAVNFYLSVFKKSRRLEVQHNTGGAPGPADIHTIAFELEGQTFTALNGGRLLKKKTLDIAELEHAAEA